MGGDNVARDDVEFSLAGEVEFGKVGMATLLFIGNGATQRQGVVAAYFLVADGEVDEGAEEGDVEVGIAGNEGL